jgi:hypothetical protein
MKAIVPLSLNTCPNLWKSHVPLFLQTIDICSSACWPCVSLSLQNKHNLLSISLTVSLSSLFLLPFSYHSSSLSRALLLSHFSPSSLFLRPLSHDPSLRRQSLRPNITTPTSLSLCSRIINPKTQISISQIFILHVWFLPWIGPLDGNKLRWKYWSHFSSIFPIRWISIYFVLFLILFEKICDEGVQEHDGQ